MGIISNLSSQVVYNATDRKLMFSQFYWSAAQSKSYIENALRRKDEDWQAVLLIPLLGTIILALTVFLILLFRQNPTLVIATISSSIICITIYLILCALHSARVVLI